MVVFEISPDIADVKTLQIGDTVNIAYRNAILTRMDKVASSGIRERIDTEVMQPASDGEVSSTRSVEFVATVLKIDRKKPGGHAARPDSNTGVRCCPDVIARQPESRRFRSRRIYLLRCRFGCPRRDCSSVSCVARQLSLQQIARTVRSE
jgi:hypothetical protein